MNTHYSEDEAGEMPPDRLERFGAIVEKWVREAIDARDASNIEARWREDLQQYYDAEVGIAKARGIADQAAAAPASDINRRGERQTKSRVTVNITRPKTNSAIARLSDMLLPTDGENWGIEKTPDPKVSEGLRQTGTEVLSNGQQVIGPDGQPATVASISSAIMDEATKRAKAMQREIADQLTECNYNAQQRLAIWDMCVLGTAILRGPYAKTRVSRSWKKELSEDGVEVWSMSQIEDTVPAVVRVNPWRFYPDPSCGGEIQNCRYTVEEDDFNSKMLRSLRGQEGYITENIDLCLAEGPRSVRRSGRSMEHRYVEGEYQYDERSVFEVFIVYGEFTRGDLYDAGVDECGCTPEEELEGDSWREDATNGCVMLCNGRVIKAFMNPLPDGSIPYSVATYERIDGQIFGFGIPFILRNPQRVVTAAWRMTLDNAALSSGGQIVVNRKLIEPADGSWTITGTKIWWAKDGTDDVQRAFSTFQFDGRQQEMMQIIERATRFAEDESNLPAIMEGSTTDAPQTVGVATTLTNNANTVLRRLVKTYDDDITDPMITRFYDWNMEHSPKEEIKGDFQVDARGSSVLLVRDLQKQALAQMSNLVLHPVLGRFHLRMGYDWLRMLYESNHISPESVLISDEKVDDTIKQFEEAAAQEQPQDPRIASAQIKAQNDQALAQAKLADAERERQFDMQKWQTQYQLELIKYANDNKQKLDDVKASMTELMLKSRHEERMQEREASLKQQFGSGL